MIKDPSEMSFSDKKLSILLYGSPGLGKTTLALSAPNPVLIDFDRGISRVKAYHRKKTIFCSTYEEVLDDLKSSDVRECETLIIDTGGSFITFLQDWAMRDNPAQNCQKNGTISLKGFGAVKAEFSRFTNMVRDTLNKNVVYVFHSIEEKDKDGNPLQRLLCEGSARNNVWQPLDLGGFIQMVGNKRYISFTPEQEFFAKGCYGIEGRREIPALGPNDKNDFLTKLFEEARKNIAAEMEAFAPEKEQYEVVMAEIAEIIEAIKTVEDANAAAANIPKLKHALTSKKESSAMLKTKTISLRMTWDKANNTYKQEAE